MLIQFKNKSVVIKTFKSAIIRNVLILCYEFCILEGKYRNFVR